jgi:hypothetical protein
MTMQDKKNLDIQVLFELLKAGLETKKLYLFFIF